MWKSEPAKVERKIKKKKKTPKFLDILKKKIVRMKNRNIFKFKLLLRKYLSNIIFHFKN